MNHGPASATAMAFAAIGLWPMVLALTESRATAAVHFVDQSNVAAISFSQPDFSDARIDGANTLSSTADAPGDSVIMGWSSSHNTNQSVGVSGGVAVSVINPGTSPFLYSVAHPTGAPGSHTYFYTRTQPDGPQFFASTMNGLPVLHLEVSSSPVVAATGTFTWAATIPGDWSSLGTGPGQAQLLSYNTGWQVTQNFVFDGAVTRVQLDRLPGTTSGPGVTMRLYGVPGPGGIALLCLAGLCAARRR